MCDGKNDDAMCHVLRAERHLVARALVNDTTSPSPEQTSWYGIVLINYYQINTVVVAGLIFLTGSGNRVSLLDFTVPLHHSVQFDHRAY